MRAGTAYNGSQRRTSGTGREVPDCSFGDGRQISGPGRGTASQCTCRDSCHPTDEDKHGSQ